MLRGSLMQRGHYVRAALYEANSARLFPSVFVGSRSSNAEQCPSCLKSRKPKGKARIGTECMQPAHAGHTMPPQGFRKRTSPPQNPHCSEQVNTCEPSPAPCLLTLDKLTDKLNASCWQSDPDAIRRRCLKQQGDPLIRPQFYLSCQGRLPTSVSQS